MSPIIFNFASNILLVAAEARLQGIRHAEQWPLKAMAFTDNTVFGLSCICNKTIFAQLMDLYEQASNVKVNMNKTIVVKIVPTIYLSPPSYVLSVDTLVFRHLGILFNNKGLALQEMESKLITDLVDHMGK
ncbi:hypothetical protein DSO57_1023055 [Entomophthora muscae]|uniref:Uncharacterized protein n=1 Tax=Entomophthora muscae TaxID=34485 RepID=A0ACC2S4T6_9FUNG|nr:hypothetical protein DSO57_1023055 [Entomophthora muscae]